MAMEDDTFGRTPIKKIKLDLPEQMPFIPPEIISKILLRLPVKSLLQFRSVSKSWLSIISDPKFIKTHYTLYSKNQENAHHRLVFSSYGHRQIIIKSCHLYSIINDASVNPIEHYFSLNRPHDVRIVGCVNGLVCIVVDQRQNILWNPSTRISKKLPSLGGVDKQCPEDLIFHGFGYDESTNDYKVVRIDDTVTKYVGEIEVRVYSLRRDCWRRIDDFPLGILIDKNGGKFVNNAIHWIVCFTRDGDLVESAPKSIVSLDLTKESYSEVPQPDYGEGEFALNLGVSRERLLVLCDVASENRMDVWIMKEYGVRDSWTKLVSISHWVNYYSHGYPRLLHILENGEILLMLKSQSVLYNPKTKSLKKLDDLGDIRQANICIESLVSPLIQTEMEGPQ